MRMVLALTISLLSSGCAVMAPAYVDQNSLMMGRLQAEVESLRWTLDRERKESAVYLK